VTLAIARERLAETKKLLATGRDPAVQAKLAKITRIVSATNTFSIFKNTSGKAGLRAQPPAVFDRYRGSQP
jgi:hypothetical protein